MKTVLFVAGALGLGTSAQALATCAIHNDTNWSFTVESGNTSNQSVGSHTHTSIAAGKIKGVDKKAGKSVSGTCKDGDKLVVKDEGGIPVLSVK